MLSLTSSFEGYFCQIKAHSEGNHRQRDLVSWTVDVDSAYLCRFKVQMGFDINHWLRPRGHKRMGVYLVLFASGYYIVL